MLANAIRHKAGGGLSQAREVLIEAKARFPADHLIYYHLARCECQLGNLRAAKAWLRSAFADGAETDLRGMAIDEPDLQPLWDQIGSI